MDTDREYQLRIKGDMLKFRTSSYKAEPISALHSGIYNRELTSSIAAGAVIVAIALFAVFQGVDIGTGHYVLAIVLFALLTLLARFYIFYEEYLEMSIDRSKGNVEVVHRQLTKKTFTRSLDDLTGLLKGIIVISPENADGIEIVKNVSLQHGMVIPGLGESKEYQTVNLEFGQLDTIEFFTTEDPEEAEAVYQVINKFVGGGVAKKD